MTSRTKPAEGVLSFLICILQLAGASHKPINNSQEPFATSRTGEIAAENLSILLPIKGLFQSWANRRLFSVLYCSSSEAVSRCTAHMGFFTCFLAYSLLLHITSSVSPFVMVLLSKGGWFICYRKSTNRRLPDSLDYQL